MRRIRDWLDWRSRKTLLECENIYLIDRIRQIEWRLAMCRSTAPDVHLAHSLAADALMTLGKPLLEGATHYAIRQTGFRKD